MNKTTVFNPEAMIKLATPSRRDDVNKNCPNGKTCGYAEFCTLSDIHDHCSIYRDAVEEATKEPNPNK